MNKLPSFKDLLSRAHALYKHRWKTLLALIILPGLAALAIGIVAAVVGFVGLSYSNWIFYVIAGLIFIMAILAILPSGPAIILNVSQETNIGWKHSYKLGLKQVGPYIWVAILVALATAGGFFLLIVPGVLLLGWLSMSRFTLLLENEKGMNALLKSREYAKGRWWSVTWRWFLPGLLLIILQAILRMFPQVVQSVGNIAIALYSATFIVAYQFILYKAIKESYVPVGNPPKKLNYIFFVLVPFIVIAVALVIFLLHR